MTAVFLNLIVILVCAWAIYRGWRRGGPRQMPPILGWCVAVIAVRVFSPGLANELLKGGLGVYTDGDLCAVWLAILLVYGFTAFVITIISWPLSKMLSLVASHAFGGIIGALLTLLRWSTLLSILLNLWAAADQECTALDIAAGGDGGMVEGVLHIAPILMGVDDFEEIIIRRQLREAKTISLLTPLYEMRADDFVMKCHDRSQTQCYKIEYRKC